MKLRKLFVALLVCSMATPPAPFTASVHAADPVALKDLDGHFPFDPPASLEAWEKRRDEVRQQIKVSLGLLPMPTMAPVKPVVHSTREMDGYALSKVYFESLPGFFVTGTLYTPIDGRPPETKRPGILCPHGHWDNGRFFHASDRDVKKELATGAERFESAAKNPLQARSVQLARMGCVVFLYDMIGYADSQQISFDRAHRYGVANANPEVPTGSWLFFSPEAEENLQSIMGLQTLNTLQAFEFLQSRTDVDPSKIAITGASGGGTQSFIAAAIEPRIAAAMPCVMVGTHMQGGCTCENASLLRIGTGNVEIAAAIAPRPLGLTTADDWTREMARDGFPELQKVYAFFDAPKKVELHPGLHFPHNYNHVSRGAMYGFINRNFGLGFEEPILERDFEFQTAEQLTVWNEQHPAPEKGIELEAKLLRYWQEDASRKIQADPTIAKAGWQTILSFSESIARSISSAESADPGSEFRGTNPQGHVVFSGKLPEGKIAQLAFSSLKSTGGDAAATPPYSPEVCVVEIRDPSGQELVDGLQPMVSNPRPAPSYTYGYNPSWMQRRVGVALSVLDRLAEQKHLASELVLRGGPEDTVLLRMLLKARPELIKEVIVREGAPQDAVDGADAAGLSDYRAPTLVPGLKRYGL